MKDTPRKKTRDAAAVYILEALLREYCAGAEQRCDMKKESF